MGLGRLWATFLFNGCSTARITSVNVFPCQSNYRPVGFPPQKQMTSLFYILTLLCDVSNLKVQKPFKCPS